MDFIVAGASFPCGVGALGEVAVQHHHTPIFIDHPHNAASTDAGLSPLRFEKSLPKDVGLGRGRFLPLLESWVSEGRNLPKGGGLRFDRRAATISRSKYALSMALAEAGVSHVPRYRVEKIEEALRVGSECGYPAVLRADSGYSGRGVWIVHSADDLRALWERQKIERASADFAEMRSVLNANGDVLIFEPWLESDEWSIDCVVGSAGIYLIRVCEKATSIVAGRPVTLGYRLTDSVELWAELRQAIERWSRVLFQAGEVSFACFDIRRHLKTDLVPLDFGVRLGGDSIPLLVRSAGSSRNAYAAALDAALAGDAGRMASLRAGPAIVHAFARQPGTFAGITVLGNGKPINSRPHGFVVTQQQGLAVNLRVGSVLTYFNTYDEFCHACRTSAEWIQVNFR